MSKRVLVADDESHIRRILHFNLQRAGYTVLVSEDGEAALATAQAERPDLVILDVAMPGLTGVEVCRRLKGESGLADTPVFLLTARGQASDEREGLTAGADRFFTKPFSPKALLDEVRRAIGTP